MRAAVKPRDEIQDLQSINRVIKTHRLNSEVKPCVNLCISEGCEFIGQEAGDLLHFTITELKNSGKTQRAVEIVIEDWLERGSVTPMSYKSWSRMIERAYNPGKTDYEYKNCVSNRDKITALKYYCERVIDTCEFEEQRQKLSALSRTRKRKPGADMAEFYSAGSHHKLNPGEIVLYFGLIQIEHKRGYLPGQLIISSYRGLSRSSGLKPHSIKPIAIRLKEKGFIEFTPGTPGQNSNQASKFKRILPLQNIK